MNMASAAKPRTPPPGGWPRQVIGRPVCPACGSYEAKTRSSRRDKRDRRVIQRYYECSDCHAYFPVLLYPVRLGVLR